MACQKRKKTQERDRKVYLQSAEALGNCSRSCPIFLLSPASIDHFHSLKRADFGKHCPLSVARCRSDILTESGFVSSPSASACASHSCS
jgi:hypothetical protein